MHSKRGVRSESRQKTDDGIPFSRPLFVRPGGRINSRFITDKSEQFAQPQSLSHPLSLSQSQQSSNLLNNTCILNERFVELDQKITELATAIDTNVKTLNQDKNTNLEQIINDINSLMTTTFNTTKSCVTSLTDFEKVYNKGIDNLTLQIKNLNQQNILNIKEINYLKRRINGMQKVIDEFKNKQYQPLLKTQPLEQSLEPPLLPGAYGTGLSYNAYMNSLNTIGKPRNSPPHIPADVSSHIPQRNLFASRTQPPLLPTKGYNPLSMPAGIRPPVLLPGYNKDKPNIYARFNEDNEDSIFVDKHDNKKDTPPCAPPNTPSNITKDNQYTNIPYTNIYVGNGGNIGIGKDSTGGGNASRLGNLSSIFDLLLPPTDAAKAKTVKEAKVTTDQYDGIKLTDDERNELKDILFNIESINDIIELNKVSEEKVGRFNSNYKFRILYSCIEPIKELHSLVGLAKLKRDIFKHICYYANNLQKNEDLNHIIITGPPGVGKTRVSQILGKLYLKMGFLKNDTFNSYKRSDLIGRYLGETSIKTQKAIDDCLGGVMLIDEAYELGSSSRSSDDMYSKECLNCINRNLSEHGNEFLCIIAGYEKSIDKDVLSKNQGLKRRFGTRFNIEGYSLNDLYTIFCSKLQDWTLENPEYIRSRFYQIDKNLFEFYAADMEVIFKEIRYHYALRLTKTIDPPNKIISNEDFDTAIEGFIKQRHPKTFTEMKHQKEKLERFDDELRKEELLLEKQQCCNYLALTDTEQESINKIVNNINKYTDLYQLETINKETQSLYMSDSKFRTLWNSISVFQQLDKVHGIKKLKQDLFKFILDINNGLFKKENSKIKKHIRLIGSKIDKRIINAITQLYYKLELVASDCINTKMFNSLHSYNKDNCIELQEAIDDSFDKTLVVTHVETGPFSSIRTYYNNRNLRDFANCLCENINMFNDKFVVILNGDRKTINSIFDLNSNLDQYFYNLEVPEYTDIERIKQHDNELNCLNKIELTVDEETKINGILNTITEAKHLLNLELLQLNDEQINRYKANRKFRVYWIGKDSLKELSNMKGYSKVVTQVFNIIQNIANGTNKNHHIKITGGYGTGKATISTIISKLYFALDIVETDKIEEFNFNDAFMKETESMPYITEKMEMLSGNITIIKNINTSPQDYHLNLLHHFTKSLLKTIENTTQVVVLTGNKKTITKILTSEPKLNMKFIDIDLPTLETKDLFDIIVSYLDGILIKDENNCRNRFTKGEGLSTSLLAMYGNRFRDINQKMFTNGVHDCKRFATLLLKKINEKENKKEITYNIFSDCCIEFESIGTEEQSKPPESLYM